MVRMIESIPAAVCLVLTSEPLAAGVPRARRRGVRVELMPRTAGHDGHFALNWDAVDALLRREQITRIFLLGFMRIVPAEFLEKWPSRVWNLHPSLLPLYPGLRSIEKAFLAGDGCGVTVHEVIPAIDSGPILLQRSVAASSSGGVALSDVERLVHIEEQRVVERVLGRGQR